MTKKQQFLLAHNKLSPLSLQATMDLLSRFRIEKISLFKDKDWSIDKLRRPFILWLSSLTAKEKNLNDAKLIADKEASDRQKKS